VAARESEEVGETVGVKQANVAFGYEDAGEVTVFVAATGRLLGEQLEAAGLQVGVEGAEGVDPGRAGELGRDFELAAGGVAAEDGVAGDAMTFEELERGLSERVGVGGGVRGLEVCGYALGD